ncbi:MAG: hypothetical protein ABGZ35_13735, partial [Planctomycetaceae bacterium]
ERMERISCGPFIRVYSRPFAVHFRWQPLFPVKTDAGSIANVVDAASVDSTVALTIAPRHPRARSAVAGCHVRHSRTYFYSLTTPGLTTDY